MTDYVELRARSAFSFLGGASLPEDLVARAAALDYAVLALGDRDGVYGAPRFHQAATKAAVRAIIGCAITVEAVRLTANSPKCSLYLLVAERSGYRNLCRLLTDVALRAPKGQAVTTWEDLEGRTDGLICLAGGVDGPIAAVLAVGGSDPPTANRLTANRLLSLQSLFPGRLYIDIQRHLEPEEERLNRILMAIAEHHRVPLVATNDVRHALPDGRRLLDVLTCLAERTTLDGAGRRLLANAERHLKPARVMAALFRDCPQALRNTRRIAEQCAFTLADLGYRFPDYPLPPGETAIGYLRALTGAAARRRYGIITPRIRRQLDHELAVIGQLDLAGYFLIVWDIVRYCGEANILAQGRGSAANSAVCYALGITAVDPIGMNLLFERFLSPERGEWPDIDIDLPSGERRERVIQYVYQRYGERGAAMTANVITYRTRSAVREVGKALGFAAAQIDRLATLLHRFEFRDDLDELAVQLRAAGVDPDAPRVRLLVDLVARIQHLPRHLGQHSGGMIIAAGRLDEVVPLAPATMPGRVVVQWDKDDCADLGIIKVDLLGLGMLAVLEEAIPLIHAHEGVAVDLAQLPPDDPTTYAMLQRADTIGVFQVESRAQMATLPRLKPEHFYDLVVEVAIIRPGPIVGQMVHPYLDRRRGRAPITYAHPDLEPILARTLGVPLFQEQLLRMAMVLANFSGGEAEELRRAMGFKRSLERMRDIEARLRAGMVARGITGAAAETIVKSITSFALYGFPESHAASFALLAYASAYLRAHHLAAFTCAMLNNWPLGFYHPATLVKDAQRHGLRVLPVDVTRSAWRCTLERVVGLLGCYVVGKDEGSDLPARGLALRLGLRFVSGLREEAAQRIIAVRAAAPFTSVADVAQRASLRDDELQVLAHAGVLSPFGLTRREAMWQAAAVPKGPLFRFREAGHDSYAAQVQSNTEHEESDWNAWRPEVNRSGQPTRAEDVPAPVAQPPPCVGRSRDPSARASGINRQTPQSPHPVSTRSTNDPTTNNLPPMSSLDRTLADYQTTGLTVGPHLLRHLRAELDERRVLRARDLARAANGAWVKVAGLVIVRQRPGTAKGFCFLTLEDETGLSNAVVTPGRFQRYRAVIHTAALLQVEGPLQRVEDVIHVRARRLTPLALPQRVVTQTSGGYRMRVTLADDEPALPKSHDFR